MNVAKFVRVPRLPQATPAPTPPQQGAAPPAETPRAWGLTLGSWFTPPPPKRDRR